MVKHTILFIIIFIYTAFSQPVRIKAYTDKPEYLIGDPVSFKVEIEHENNIKFIKPAILDSLKAFEKRIEQPPQVTVNGNLRKTVYSFVATSFDSSMITIPAMNFRYFVGKDTLLMSNPAISLLDTLGNTALSNPVTVQINAVKTSMEEDIKDIKDPLEIPFSLKEFLAEYGLLILAGLVFIAAVIYAVRYFIRKRKTKQEEKVVYIPPYLAALNKLETLEKEKLWQKGEIKEFHSRITGIIREYFEKGFNFPALELTSTEILQVIRTKEELKEIYSISESFFINADLVKFAKFVPVEYVNEEMLSQAKEMVNKTIPVETETGQNNVQ